MNTGRATSLWIAWSDHRRTTGLCNAWDIPLTVVRSRRSGPSRWLQLATDTLRLLRERRPEILFVQCPSLALTTLGVLLRPFFGYFFVVDAHNEAVRPYDRPYAAVRWLSRRLLRTADMTIVSNDALRDDVSRTGGRAVVLPDGLPVVPSHDDRPGEHHDNPDVVVVATYRLDEPIGAILAAAKSLPEVTFAFTGPGERLSQAHPRVSDNVRVTGFLEDREYWALLEQSRVICDLTLKTDCLVCGAYEALALGKPMILSDNHPTREIFGKAALLTDAHPNNIAETIRTGLDQQQELEAEARLLRARYPAFWRKQANRVLHSIRSKSGVDIGKPA